MKAFLVRKIPRKIRHHIEKCSSSQGLSMNQYFVQVMIRSEGKIEFPDEPLQDRDELFRRIDEFREEMYRKYGSFDDSTKLIREDRDTR